MAWAHSAPAHGSELAFRCHRAAVFVRFGKLIGRVNRSGKPFGADHVRWMPFMIRESWNTQDACGVGSCRIGAELPHHLPHRGLSLLLVESLHLPRNLPVIGRSIDDVVRFRNVLATLKMLYGSRAVLIEVQIEMAYRSHISAGSAAGVFGQGVHGDKHIASSVIFTAEPYLKFR